jgi:hypothetical protein
LAVVSSDSGNCTDEILLTGLLAGVPWRGEEQGDERGEILARAPEREREKERERVIISLIAMQTWNSTLHFSL